MEIEVNTIAIAISLVIVILFLLGVIGWMAVQMRHSKDLRQRFGPEYEQALKQVGNRREAEAELEAREKRVRSFDLRPLSPEERERYAGLWKSTQARFVDDPGGAVTEANGLVKEVMEALGYPVGDFEQRAADLSVDHAEFVSHYRAARQIAQN